MKTKFAFICLAVALFSGFNGCNVAPVNVTSLRCEYMDEPLGIDVKNPRLMWKIDADGASARQTAYRVLVATSPDLIEAGTPDVWDSGKKSGAEQIAYYGGDALGSHARYWWAVEIWNGGKKMLSPPAWFETGKMSPSDWSAAWITDEHDKEYEPSPMFRKDFDISKPVTSARCYISGLGYYSLYFNGKAAGEHVLDPGFTDFGKRILYLTYDITGMIRNGQNCIGVQLGNGWFNEQTPTVWHFDRAPWRKRPQMICEIHLNYADGSREIVKTDDSWKTATGPLLFDNIHVGATYDARLEQKGWNTAGFDDSVWKNAAITQPSASFMEAHKMPSIGVSKVLESKSVTKKSDLCYVFDMGINTAGVVQLEVKGEAGTRIRLRHGEMLDRDGNVDQRNISMHLRPRNEREVIQTDEYILKGEGVETFVPPFTYHGFRYVELTSSKPVAIENIALKTLKMHSDVKETGSFRCSNDLINNIFEICRNSYLSNLYGIPTDCPTREKNGWMADGFMVQEAGMLNYDSRNIYAKWVKDMTDAQERNGNVPGIVPTSWRWNSNWAGPIWDAAIFIVPTLLYNYTGDVESMKNIYETCKRYLEYAKTIETDKGLLKDGLGDWLYYKAITPGDFMVSCYYYWDNILMAKMAVLTGNASDEAQYLQKAEELKALINLHYFDEEKMSYANETQLSYALPLYMNIAPEPYRKQLAEKLNDMVAANDYSLDFGFIGSLIVPDLMSEMGYAESVYKMVTKETMPSWGYWIKAFDATSLFETWDVSRNIGDASLNHPSMGAIAAWMYKTLAGINVDPDEPAFKKVIIRPNFIGDLDFVEAAYESQYGPVKSAWKRDGQKITLNVTIPATSTATVILPGQKARQIKGGNHVFTVNM